ncbi:hypothetical protein CHUAL_006838 [Chamberlinius hualienensis]
MIISVQYSTRDLTPVRWANSVFEGQDIRWTVKFYTKCADKQQLLTIRDLPTVMFCNQVTFT